MGHKLKKVTAVLWGTISNKATAALWEMIRTNTGVFRVLGSRGANL